MAEDISREQRITNMVNSWLSPTGELEAPQVSAPTLPSSAAPVPLGVRRVRPGSITAQEAFEDVNRVDMPIDATEEIGGLTRAMMAFRSNKEREVEYLQNRYGEESVRLSPSGNIFVKVMDAATGKPKEIPADNPDITLNDFIDLAGSLPEIAAGVLSVRAGRGAPGIGAKTGLVGWLRDALIGAAGAETAGAAKDVAVDLMDKGTTDLPAVIKDRSRMAALDVGLAGVGGAALKFWRFLRSPLGSSMKEVQFDAIKAQQYFKDVYGIEVPQSVGERTGSYFFSRGETFIEKQPGGKGPIADLAAKRDEAVRSLQRVMMGGRTPPPDEVVGQEAIDVLRSRSATLEGEVKGATVKAADISQKQIESELARKAGATRQMYAEPVGKAVRERVVALRDQAKATSDQLYAVVNSLPGGSGKVFDTAGLSQAADDILSKLPTKGNVPMNEFAPPDVVNRLQALKNLGGQKLSLSELQQMRRDTYEAMGTTQGVPGRGEHYLNQIAGAITDTIESQAAKFGSGQLKSALQNANAFYRNKVVPFNRIGITELFRDATESGLGNSAVALRAVSDPDRFRLFKEVLGETSTEFKALKRMVADDVLQTAAMPDGVTVDARSLFDAMAKYNDPKMREIGDAVFGKDRTRLTKATSELLFAQGSKIDLELANKLLSGGAVSPNAIRRAVQAQEALDLAYRNRIVRDVSTGQLDTSKINPSEFVSRFLNSAEPSEVREVMGLLAGNQQALSDVRAKTVELLFRQSARPVQPTDIAQSLGPDVTQVMSASKLAEKLKEKTFAEKIRTIVGQDIYTDLQQYLHLEAAKELKEKAFAGAGGIAAGMKIADLMGGGALKYLSHSARGFVVSKLITSPLMREWLGRAPTKAGTSADFVQLVLTSPVFLREVTRELGEGAEATSFVGGIRDAINRYVEENSGSEVQRTSDVQGRNSDRRKKAEDFINR